MPFFAPGRRIEGMFGVERDADRAVVGGERGAFGDQAGGAEAFAVIGRVAARRGGAGDADVAHFEAVDRVALERFGVADHFFLRRHRFDADLHIRLGRVAADQVGAGDRVRGAFVGGEDRFDFVRAQLLQGDGAGAAADRPAGVDLAFERAVDEEGELPFRQRRRFGLFHAGHGGDRPGRGGREAPGHFVRDQRVLFEALADDRVDFRFGGREDFFRLLLRPAGRLRVRWAA